MLPRGAARARAPHPNIQTFELGPWRSPWSPCPFDCSRGSNEPQMRLKGGSLSLKARSRKHPGLAKRQNHFHKTEDRPAQHEQLLRVRSDEKATPLRHKVTSTARARRRRRATAAAPARTRPAPRCGGRLGLRPTGSPRPIGWRSCRRGPAAAATRSGGVPTLRRRGPSGRPTKTSPHVCTCTASTGGGRRRGRRPPAAGGRVGRAPTPATRHAVGRGGQGQRWRRHGRPVGAPPRAAVPVPAGRPPPRRSPATADAAAAGR